MPTPSARDRILDTAARLFYRDGYRGTGIDRIIAESGVAKMSLYRHFPSKNDLIVAYLERRHDYWMGWFRGGVRGGWRSGNLDVMADALGEWFATEDFRGCSFINMIAEAGGGAGDDPRLLAQAVAHKASLEDFVTGIARDLGLSIRGSGGRGHALHRGHDRALADHACRRVAAGRRCFAGA
jgi:AcrR family transcriptional regulator